ncbi:bacillithiol system redox-active protein YtxJ [Sporosarcina sp. HYO08]|uniref:bacillithiol system redox-active protein YtxJ n=1 Tax=Sporosarcina sp. HYO08 TaxID=1759557 RepID=UPI0009E71E83|nr:bacillithiol system redox-active protein YtxJ [Sporosarcina sp. HYO08]
MKEIQTNEEWQALREQSKSQPLFLLKHSTTCPISAAAYHAFDAVTTELPKYFLKVQDSRPVSNAIESDLGIRHESPQLFLLKDGEAVWQATHSAINESSIQTALSE